MMNFIHRISFGFEFGNLVPSDIKILNLKRQSLNLSFKLHYSFKILLDKLVPTLARFYVGIPKLIGSFICLFFFKILTYVFFHSIGEYAVDGIDGPPLI